MSERPSGRRRAAARCAAVLLGAASILAIGCGIAMAAPVTIPVGITEWPPGTTPPATQITAEIDWLFADGSLAKAVAVAPVANGAIRADVPPLEPGLRWGIILRESGEPGPVFRSGPLLRLPTGHVPPISVLDGSIGILRESFWSDPLFEPDLHLADRIRQGLAAVPNAGLAAVSLAVDGQAWVVTVDGPFYEYRQPFTLSPSIDVGHPATVIAALPLGPGSLHATFPFLPVPSRAALQASLRASLEQFLAAYVYFLPPPPFTPTTYSVSHVGVGDLAGSLSLRLNGGRISGPPIVIGPLAGAGSR